MNNELSEEEIHWLYSKKRKEPFKIPESMAERICGFMDEKGFVYGVEKNDFGIPFRIITIEITPRRDV